MEKVWIVSGEEKKEFKKEFDGMKAVYQGQIRELVLEMKRKEEELLSKYYGEKNPYKIGSNYTLKNGKNGVLTSFEFSESYDGCSIIGNGYMTNNSDEKFCEVIAQINHK